MPIKLKDEFGHDYDRQAEKLISEYLERINSKSEQKYRAADGEVNRISEELRENNGILFDPIQIVKI